MNTLWLVSIYSREPSEVEYVKTTPKQVHIREQGSRYVEHFERVDGGELVGRSSFAKLYASRQSALRAMLERETANAEIYQRQAEEARRRAVELSAEMDN
jgi:hypothetical protein